MAAFKAKVEKLTVMKEAGIISEEEFAQMKAKLLGGCSGICVTRVDGHNFTTASNRPSK
jgi:hypothetical protein